MKLSLRKARAQHTSYACDDCQGAGVTLDQDWDDEGVIYRREVRCEACDGSASMTNCDVCDEAMPLSEAELNGYVCGACCVDRERGDQQAEVARLRRWAS